MQTATPPAPLIAARGASQCRGERDGVCRRDARRTVKIYATVGHRGVFLVLVDNYPKNKKTENKQLKVTECSI